MTICAFLGHDRVYDKDILGRLRKAVYTVAQKYKEIAFAFCGRGEFYDWCYAAVLETKYRFPKNEIHISNEIADRTTLNQASVLITYIYDGFHEKSSMTSRALKAKEIIDLTSAETASRIESLIETLPEHEQLVLQKINSGETLSQIGASLGVSGSAVRAVRANACRRLRRAMYVRLICDKPCAVFALGKASYENVRAVVYVDSDSKVEKQRTLSAVDYMLERASFCVCNLQSTIGRALRKRIAASNCVAVFDIAGSEGWG